MPTTPRYDWPKWPASLRWLAVPWCATALLLAPAASGQPTSAPLATATLPLKSGEATPALPKSLPEGAILIPSSDKTGQRTDPMILVPVQARSAPAPVLRPADTSGGPKILQLSSAPGTNGTAARPGNNGFSPAKPPWDERILGIQVALAGRGISPGSFDGLIGPQTRTALRAFQAREGLPLTGTPDLITEERLQPGETLYTNYVVLAEDTSALLPLGKTWLAKSQQPSLAYETVLELLAERTQSNPKLLRWLNPAVDWENVTPGTSLKLVRIVPPPADEKAALLRIYLGERKLQVYGANSNLIAHFPCSIAARVEKRPLGEELHITTIAPNPNYTFDPAVFPESDEAQQLGRKLILQPGPNNPVGSVWFSLDKPGYGIHGTPKPEEVGRTESHGCFRLANWNAEYLLKLVALGTPVSVEP
jgi:lipoprotein-anchoring transpeptidase ErfK/SrfK